MAANMSPPSLFDIPAKSPEEMKSIVQDLPNIRKRAGVDSGAGKVRGNGSELPKRNASVPVPKTREQKQAHAKSKGERITERRERAKDLIRNHQPEPGMIRRMEEGHMKEAYRNAIKTDPNLEDENNAWLRDLSSSSTRYTGEVPDYMAPIDVYYDKWAQAYRLLGGFIDCDNEADGSGDNSGDGGGDGDACSRWMMWAAYANPNYNGGERDEYFTYTNQNSNYYEYSATDDGEGGVSNLDCHSPDTEWQLLGVYRQEFYQFIEQISKHLWAIDDYEYVTALAGLAYMTDSDCTQIGTDSQGNYLYSGVMPVDGGNWEMGLYTDSACIVADTTSGLTYDSFGIATDMDLGSEDDGCLDDDILQTLYGYWTNTQEYTLATLNEVYSEYKYCTLCMDYPTYQDGYFIGDSGTDDDDMINQCWKFHSHDSYTCEADCLAIGDAQGTILQVKYDDNFFGASWDGSSGSGSSTVYDHYAKGYTSDKVSNVERFKANAFVTFSGVLFIATFLAFSVARGSRRESSEKSRSLLSSKEKKKARGSSRSKSKSRRSSSKKKSPRKKYSSSSRSASRNRSSRN